MPDWLPTDDELYREEMRLSRLSHETDDTDFETWIRKRRRDMATFTARNLVKWGRQKCDREDHWEYHISLDATTRFDCEGCMEQLEKEMESFAKT
jgi:hypothetical protein